MNIIITTGNHGKLTEYRQYFSSTPNANILGTKDIEQLFLKTYAEPVEDYDFFLGNAVLKLTSALEFIYNSIKGANKTSESTQNIYPFTLVVDDSGLAVPALNFDPGVHSAYYGGLPRSAEKNRQVLANNIAINTNKKNYKNEFRLEGFFACFLCSINIENYQHLQDICSNISVRGFNETPLRSFENNFVRDLNSLAKDEKHVGKGISKPLKLCELFEQVHPALEIVVHFGYCLGEVSTAEQQLIQNAGHGYDSMFYSRIHPDLSFSSITLEQKNIESHRAFAMKTFLEYLVSERQYH